MRRTLVLLAVLALFACPVAAVAQQTTQPTRHEMNGPPKVLSIGREIVKPGKLFVHNQHEAAWTQALTKANYGTHYLAITSVTGAPEDWFLTGFDSFAALEKDNDSMENNAALHNVMAEFMPKETDFVSENRSIIAVYKPEMSYQPNFKLGEFKYFTVGFLRMKVGHEPGELSKLFDTARKKANMDEHVVAYEIISGMPWGTYLFFSPVKSLAEWDHPPNPVFEQALKEGNLMGLAEKDAVSYEERLFSFNPKLSSMPEEVTAANPEFWHPKAEVASTHAGHTTTPAAKKETKPEKKP